MAAGTQGGPPRIRPVIARGATLGQGRPAIVVPVTAADRDGLRAEIAGLRGQPVDIVEWRLDHVAVDADAAGHRDAVLDGARALRAALDDLPGGADIPVLATLRTTREGGRRAAEDDEVLALVEALCAQGAADLLDVELSRGARVIRRVVAACRDAGVAVVISSHDFDSTPGHDEIVSRLARMEELGADVAKIAVMPRDAGDVLTLMAATWTARCRAHRPVVTIAMGAIGAPSRIVGGAFGSAATFGTVGAASAPGQIPAVRLASALDALAD